MVHAFHFQAALTSAVTQSKLGLEAALRRGSEPPLARCKAELHARRSYSFSSSRNLRSISSLVPIPAIIAMFSFGTLYVTTGGSPALMKRAWYEVSSAWAR